MNQRARNPKFPVMFPRAVLFVLASLLVLPADAALVHRWNFNEMAGTTAADSQGNFPGQLMTGAVFDGKGAVDLNGSGAFVDLPNGIVPTATNVTFEFWTTWRGNGVNSRVFDFGLSSSGEGASGTGIFYVILMPQSAVGGMRFGIASASFPVEMDVDGPAPMPMDVMTHVAITVEFPSRLINLYQDGRLISSGEINQPLAIARDLNAWLGRSNYGGDPYFNGLIHEFRIFDAALTAAEVLRDFEAGPERLGSDTGILEGIQLDVESSMKLFAEQLPHARANYENVKNVDLSGDPYLVVTSSDPSIVEVLGSGKLRAKQEGTVTVTASYHGRQDQKTIQVQPGQKLSVISLVRNGSNLTATVQTPLADAAHQLQSVKVLPAGAGDWEPVEGAAFERIDANSGRFVFAAPAETLRFYRVVLLQ